MVVRQRFPVWQLTDAQIRGEPGDFIEQALGIGGTGGDDSEQFSGVATGERLKEVDRLQFELFRKIFV